MDKNLKMTFASPFKSTDKKKEKKRKAIAKRFALHANAKRKAIAKRFALHTNAMTYMFQLVAS